MKVCSKCMAENVDDAKFCKLCASSFQQSVAKTCPSGRHTMDPLWTECAYCKADAAAGGGARPQIPLPPRPQATPPGAPIGRSKTVVEGDSGAASGLRPQIRPPTFKEDTPLPPRSAGARPFSPAAPTPGASGAVNAPPAPSRKTVYGTPLPATPSVSKARKIVGVLVTYSWRPEGKIYEVREGRNLIGRDASCDICVPEDETLSGVNSHITYRQNFVIGDMVSMMGTDLNGAPIEQQFHGLNSHALIRAGSTHFIFIAVDPRGNSQPAAE